MGKMKLKTCISLIREDYQRIDGGEAKFIFLKGVGRIFVNESFCITFWFRIGTYLLLKDSIWAKALLIPVKIIHRLNQRITGIQLPIGTQIEGGLKFFHYSCIIIASSVQIGKCCSIHQGVTLGRVFAGKKAGVPSIKDNVIIFSGAKVIGNITIGNNVVIGANAVVVDNVPDNVVVGGIPATILSNDSSRVLDDYWRQWFRIK